MDPVLLRKKLLKVLCALFSNEAAFEEYGWILLPPEIYIQMNPRGKPESKSLVRITFEGFPEQAPSYILVNPQTKAVESHIAWPTSAYKPDWPGFCLNGTREFYTKGHPDRTPQWSPEGFPVAAVLQEIQVELNRGS